jgi:hypothetical protein
MNKKNLKDYLAVIKLPKQFLDSLFSNGLPLTTAVHGVRDIKILNSVYLDEEDMIVFLITSPDIPAYVAIQKIMEKLQYLDAVDPNTLEDIKLPQVILEYIRFIPPMAMKKNDEMQYGDEDGR